MRQLGQSEVENLAPVVARDQDILRLQIVVADSLLMRRRQATRHLYGRQESVNCDAPARCDASAEGGAAATEAPDKTRRKAGHRFGHAFSRTRFSRSARHRLAARAVRSGSRGASGTPACYRHLPFALRPLVAACSAITGASLRAMKADGCGPLRLIQSSGAVPYVPPLAMPSCAGLQVIDERARPWLRHSPRAFGVWDVGGRHGESRAGHCSANNVARDTGVSMRGIGSPSTKASRRRPFQIHHRRT